MRFGIIICLIVLLFIVVVFYRRRTVSLGYWFCKLSEEFFELLKKVKEIQDNPEIKDVRQAVLTDNIKFCYEPNNWKFTFFQYDIIIAKILDIYSLIEFKERFFRVEDWKKIENIHRQLNDEMAHIKYLKWVHGYRK